MEIEMEHLQFWVKLLPYNGMYFPEVGDKKIPDRKRIHALINFRSPCLESSSCRLNTC